MTQKSKLKLISNRAAVQRINRVLMPDKIMKYDRRSAVRLHYVVKIPSGVIKTYVNDIDAYGKKLGVIDPWEAVEPARDIRYISGMGTLPKTVPEGRFLHHNHVMHTVNMGMGFNGFRAWTSSKVLDGFAKCPCGWAGLPHYALKEHIKATKGKAETAEHFAARMKKSGDN